MKFLLDVTALVAWRHPSAHGHARFHAWAAVTGFEQLATCAVSELGFIRVSMQVYRYTLAEAQTALDLLKTRTGGFVASPSPQLPAWATTAAKTSDGYLSQVASDAGLQLATFDVGIPGAVVI